MVKRKGHILEQIAAWDNLVAADKEAQAGKVKKNRHIRRHNLHQKEDLERLQRMILTLDFPKADYTEMEVHNDSGKDRIIDKQDYFPWRILHHAIMRVIGDDIYGGLIFDSFACVPGKGLHHGVKRMKMMLRRYPEYRWYWKTDYKKYYQSIPHSTILDAFRRKYKDERFIRLIDVAILNYDTKQEILDALDEEKAKKARNTHRCVHQPADRQLHRQPDRPPDEGKSEGEMLSPVLRRYHRPGPDKG